MARENYIGGTWRAAKSGTTDEVRNPATGELLDEVAASDRVDVDEAVAAAGAAFGEWSPHDAATPVRGADEGRRRDRR